VEKAAREAKRKTSWLEPNEQFESATREFVEALYRDETFLRDFERFVQPLIEPGRINSLSLALLKLTAPGIPDLYQGSELWDLSLVDPDNRRPVDYDLRRRLLCEILRLDVKQVWSRMDEGLPKLWTTYHALRVRRQHPECFVERGGYMPFRARGPKAAHVVAYLRGASVLAVAPRLIVKLASKWGDTTLKVPDGNWKNELSGEQFASGEIKVSDLLDAFPVALLVKQ
jgi:(1->4)-alpha-D-glucan 1-alpha-D-glucosylmutase